MYTAVRKGMVTIPTYIFFCKGIKVNVHVFLTIKIIYLWLDEYLATATAVADSKEIRRSANAGDAM